MDVSFRRKCFALLSFVFICSSIYAYSDNENQQPSVDRILQNIHLAYEAGLIDYETALLNKAYALFDPLKLSPQFRLEGVKPSKCGTPVILEIQRAWESLKPGTQHQLRAYFQRPPTQRTFSSPDGYFKIHYDISGQHAVYQPSVDIDPSDGVPDYVNRCAEICDHCWITEIETLGYDAPPSDGVNGGDSRYDVYLQHYEGAYGVTFPESPSSQYPGRNAWSSYIYLDPTYDGFGYSNRLDPLSVTAAHEFFHAIQFAYNTWTGSWIMEISAVWMEDYVYDEVNDYQGYLNAFFPVPEISLDASEPSLHMYGSCVWGFYLTENYGPEILQRVWEEIISSSPLSALHTALSEYGTGLEESFRDFTVWNYLTGDRANQSHPQYEEAADFPSIHIAGEYASYPVVDGSVAHGELPNHLASNYVRFSGNGRPGDLKIFFTGEGIFEWKVSVLTDSAGRYTSYEMNLDGDSGFLRIPRWETKGEAVLVPCITSRNGGPGDYTFSAVVGSASEPDFEFIEAEAFDVDGGNGDGYIDPGEEVELVIHVTNYGRPADDISASLATDDPDILLEKHTATFGDIGENEGGENSADPFLLSVTATAELHKADCLLSLVSNGGTDTAHVHFALIIGHPKVLLVDDDYALSPRPETFDVEGYYRSSLDGLDEIYDEWSIEQGGSPDSTFLKAYQTIIWFTGYAAPALTAENQRHLSAFLDGGGRLFLTGQDIASELRSTNFLRDYLHARFVSDLSDQRIVYGVPDDPISGDIFFFSTLGEPGANNQVSPDVIDPLDGASVVFTYSPPAYETAAVKYEGDSYKVVFFSFGFEGIVNLTGDTETLRSQILDQVLTWLSAEEKRADVNADGEIDLLDMIRVAYMIFQVDPLPSEYELWAADCDGNGVINVFDILGIANVILGIGTCEP
jgi:hypothetical protein